MDERSKRPHVMTANCVDLVVVAAWSVLDERLRGFEAVFLSGKFGFRWTDFEK
jgi:hypothetical protein